MNKRVKIGNGTLVITDKLYRASGGEAAIYVSGSAVYKMYHDPKKRMLPLQKIAELRQIYNPQVIVPQDVIYDASSGEPLGYTMMFVDDVFPLLKLFTKTFKMGNNIDPAMIAALIKTLQQTASDIHAAKCLVVDFNELNVLVKLGATLVPWFIDVDSYATPSFKATAIMNSVRDRRVSTITNGQLHYAPDVLSDWFSWGILSFWLYTNIHPFRGNHPKYRPDEKVKQMDDGISVFHKGVKVPPTTNDFNLIPKRHLDWFKAVFGKNERSIPPLPDSIAPVAVPKSVVIVSSTDKIEVIEVATYPEEVMATFQFSGLDYAVTRTHIYRKETAQMSYNRTDKALMCSAGDGSLIVAYQNGSRVWFAEFVTGKVIGTVTSDSLFVRNDAAYTVANGKMVENTFSTLAGRLVHRANSIEYVSTLTATAYDGCIIQDLLGKKYLTLPYARGRSFSKYLPQLDGFRVIEAKSERNVTVILGERGGVYSRFIVVFSRDYASFEVREAKDVTYDTINFTVMESGPCLLLASPTEAELFTDATKFEVLNDPPFDATMRLFSTPSGIFFVNGNSVHQIKRK